ncbi:MAG TPA: FeoA family protein [Pseudomonadales bacterium]|nr:FeoA family protein [Pseudomonadales bacterium]
MNLADMNPETRCLVTAAADDNPELKSRLYALGVYPGVEVEVLRYAPAGDPMQIRIGSTLLSIRRREARHILVEDLA